MANAGRNQEHLAIDTSVLVAYLDGEHPSHGQTDWLSKEAVALNPTVVHEAYHTLVFKMKWTGEAASESILEALSDERVRFVNQSMRTTRAGLRLAVELGLGGRDALILATFVTGRIREFVTFDADLLRLRRVTFGRDRMTIRAPRPTA